MSTAVDDVVLSLEDVSKDYPPPGEMRVRRFFARLRGLQLDESLTADMIGAEEGDDDDLDDDDEPVREDEELPDRGGAGLRVIDGISLEAHAGSLVGLVGAEGAGKTILLKLMGGVVAPSEGRVTVRGRVAPALSVISSLIPTKGHTVEGALPQVGAMVGIPHGVVRSHMDEIFDFAESPALRKTGTAFLDSPRKREVILATMLCVEPSVFLTDIAIPEDAFGERCLERIDDLRANGTLVVAEIRNLRKSRLVPDRVIRLDHGRVVED